MKLERFGAAAEFKFAADATATGVFEGYAAIFGNTDTHGDVITPGAFSGTMASHKAAGTMPALFVEHGPALGYDPLPSGVWLDLAEDGRGLKGTGKISALDTDHGKRIRGLMQDGALKGLSIGFMPSPGGAVMGTKASEPKRTLKRVELIEVSVVRNPSNTLATVTNIKAALDGGRVPTSEEFETLLYDAGFTRNQAENIAKMGYSALHPGDTEANAEVKSVMLTLNGFKLS